MGLLLFSTKRQLEAESYFQLALTIAKNELPAEHPEVATCLNNVAMVLQYIGKLDEAEPLYREALRIKEAVLGPKNPEVAFCLNNLSVLLQAAKRFEEAEPYMRRHVEILLHFTHETGQMHPHLGQAFGNYANLLEQSGYSPQQANEQLNALGRRFGIQLA